MFLGALYAGLELNICGAAFPHTVGYVLTENFNVPHGKACAVLFPALFSKAKKYCPGKSEAILDCMNTEAEVLISAVRRLSVIDLTVTAAEIDEASLRWKNGVKNFDITTGGFT